MKNLQIRYSHDNEEMQLGIEQAISDLLNGDMAVGDASILCVPWYVRTLLIGLTEAYYTNNLVEHTVLIGIASFEQRMVQVFTQDYMHDDPQEALAAVADNHMTTDYVAIYVEV